MTSAKKSWSQLTPAQRSAVVVIGAVELVLTAVALTDLVRRPGSEVRGPKLAWGLGCLVQPVGPIAYLAAGRRPTP
ncbi:MAG TPA: PLD nuclease N-terminal domain-containing protein [Dermatophilaceae bacterium]|nr:PLD nuclease N-terminal domain-containing protein [Dermatophilaceae bacterium]